MPTNNAINLREQGVAYYNGISTFDGLDGITAGFVLTSNGTNVAPSFQAAGSSGFSQIIKTQVTSTQTFTFDANTQFVFFEAVGGGGGGAGSFITTGTGQQVSVGGGGGAAAYVSGLYTIATTGASVDIVVGAGGNGGVGGSGADGTFTSITSAGTVTLLESLPGMGGDDCLSDSGVTAGPQVSALGGAGGTGLGSGDLSEIISVGESGGSGVGVSVLDSAVCFVTSGFGGSSPFGGGGAQQSYVYLGVGSDGQGGQGYGSGGAGGCSPQGQNSHPGGDGAAGIVYITEYIT